MSKQFPAISVATRGRVKRKSLCELCRAIRILNCLPYPQAVSNKKIKKRGTNYMDTFCSLLHYIAMIRLTDHSFGDKLNDKI